MTTQPDELAGDSVLASETSEIAANSGSDKGHFNHTATLEGNGKSEGEQRLSGAPRLGFGVAKGDESEVSDVQKKIWRAERFGMPVLLSEEEKRNSRAERFGTASKSPCSEASKASEELKRKARAERFGIPVPPTPSDEEAKKKARLARFGGPVKDDSIEEDKRKARAIRFSKPVSGPPS